MFMDVITVYPATVISVANAFFKLKQGFHGDTHSEEVGPAFGLLPDGCRGVGGLRYVDAQLLLAGAGRGGHRGRIVAQAPAAVTRLEGQKGGLRLV